MKFAAALFFTSLVMFSATARAEYLSGTYQMLNAGCLPKFPDLVKPVTVKIDAENYRLSFSTPVQSSFSDVGVFDMPIDSFDVGTAASGSGATSLRQSGAYAAGGTQFKFSFYNDRGLLRYASFSLSANGTLVVKYKKDQDPKTRSCTGRKIQ